MEAGRAEKTFLKRIKPYKDKVYYCADNSAEEGFEFLSKGIPYKNGKLKKTNKVIMFSRMSKGHVSTMLRIFKKWMYPMMKGRKKCFSDLKPYIDELEKDTFIAIENTLLSSFPNLEIWDGIKSYAMEKWNCHIGFTHLPRELIFRDKAVLFEYAIVAIFEMDKDKIDCAPGLEAGEEVQRAYALLGLAVNDIAEHMRRHYNIKCQSNHPLGGLVNNCALAAKAGLGWQGCNGLLITPQFGQRCRIAPIFIQEKYFEYTDSDEHKWIESFCATCHKCVRACPTKAIYDEKRISIPNVEGIGCTRTCIDIYKCYEKFIQTLGCSICIKVCPFSQGEGSYDKIKKLHLKE